MISISLKRSTIFVLACLFVSMSAAGQNASTPGGGPAWVRIQSDSGEFSIDFPETFNKFFDKQGFWITEPGSTANFELREMTMFSAYVDGALLTIESYKAPKGALRSIRKMDAGDLKDTEIDRGGYKINQFIRESGAGRMTRQYMYSKTHVYVLTAASRSKDDPTVNRFLNSLHFDPLSKKGPSPTVYNFSNLPTTKVEMLQDADYKPDRATVPPKAPKDERVTPLVILSKPRASYTDAARMNNVQGNIRFRLTLSENGFIPKVQLLGKGLPALLRQAFFSAMRIKFLPKLIDQKPVATEVTFDYGFNIY